MIGFGVVVEGGAGILRPSISTVGRPSPLLGSIMLGLLVFGVGGLSFRISEAS